MVHFGLFCGPRKLITQPLAWLDAFGSSLMYKSDGNHHLRVLALAREV
jgi:hypothetical protein